ncbi:MAG: LysE family transporter [Actinobacteria bacterium]|nr:LysE family transporter [Actinomycetota bacterium]
MSVGLFLEGIVIGFAIAAPVGPIGVLCIRRTLADGRVSGLVSGLGAATADALYGAVAALGLTFVAEFLMGGESWLRLVGGAFLVVLGVRTFLARPAGRAAPDARRSGLPGAYASTLFLTLTNPTTILSFAAIFAGLGVAADASGSALSAMLLVLGVFLGSAAWWVVLSGATSLFRTRLSVRGLRWVNRISGTVIAAFGVLAISGLGG